MSEREAANAKRIGPRRYKERIDKGSKDADNKNLPFKFSKPGKDKVSTVLVVCITCGNSTLVNTDTILSLCNYCKTLNRVTRIKH